MRGLSLLLRLVLGFLGGLLFFLSGTILPRRYLVGNFVFFLFDLFADGLKFLLLQLLFLVSIHEVRVFIFFQDDRSDFLNEPFGWHRQLKSLSGKQFEEGEEDAELGALKGPVTDFFKFTVLEVLGHDRWQL